MMSPIEKYYPKTNNNPLHYENAISVTLQASQTAANIDV